MAKPQKQVAVLASAQPEALQIQQGRKILLAGEAVFASLNSSVPEGFVQQAPLEAVGGLLAQFSKNVPKIHVSVDERVFSIQKARFALALEGYVHWGLRERRKGVTVLFGGAQTEASTHVTILVFSAGKVVELGEKVLPEATATYFRDALVTMISELRIDYPAARFVQAAPLDDWEFEGVEYIGDKALRRLPYRPLIREYRPHTAFVVPAALCVLGLAFYVGGASVGWSTYSSAVAAYDTSIADAMVQERGGIDTSFLDTMVARRFYMEQPRRQSILADKAADIVKGIGGLSDVQVMELKLPAPSVNPQQQVGVTISPEQLAQRQQITSERTPDVWMSIAVPKTSDSAINQAHSAMLVIANNTGMSLRLAHQGWRDDEGRRIFSIEGFIHD